MLLVVWGGNRSEVKGDRCTVQIIVRRDLHSESDLQAVDINLLSDLEENKFPSYLLYTKTLNGWEKLVGDYLASSKIGCLFCAPCRAYMSETGTKHRFSTLPTKEGYNSYKSSWRKLYRKLPGHESSIHHKQAYLNWRTLEHASRIGGSTIDSKLQKQFEHVREMLVALLMNLLRLPWIPFREKRIKLRTSQW